MGRWLEQVNFEGCWLQLRSASHAGNTKRNEKTQINKYVPCLGTRKSWCTNVDSQVDLETQYNRNKSFDFSLKAEGDKTLPPPTFLLWQKHRHYHLPFLNVSFSGINIYSYCVQLHHSLSPQPFSSSQNETLSLLNSSSTFSLLHVLAATFYFLYLWVWLF
jgi:hypothetical protein